MKAAGKIFGGGTKPKVPKVVLPKPEPVTPMPDEEQIRRDKIKQIAMKAKGKGGRAETNLTEDDDSLA